MCVRACSTHLMIPEWSTAFVCTNWQHHLYELHPVSVAASAPQKHHSQCSAFGWIVLVLLLDDKNRAKIMRRIKIFSFYHSPLECLCPMPSNSPSHCLGFQIEVKEKMSKKKIESSSRARSLECRKTNSINSKFEYQSIHSAGNWWCDALLQLNKLRQQWHGARAGSWNCISIWNQSICRNVHRITASANMCSLDAL